MAQESKAFLSIDSLCKSFGQGEARVQVLKDISCDIERGEICVLFGPSGSGKSTFLNMVGGLEPADSEEGLGLVPEHGCLFSEAFLFLRVDPVDHTFLLYILSILP